MSPVALLVALSLALLPVHVESTDCPPAADVEQALGSRLALVSADTRPDLARVWQQEGSLHVELVNPDGVVIAERALELRGDCAEMASLVAVVIASWESDVHPTLDNLTVDGAM